MRFRTKLIFLAGLLNLLLVFWIWQIASSSQKIGDQVEQFIPATRYLQELSSIHSLVTSQTKNVLSYLLSQNILDKTQVHEGNAETIEQFQRLRQILEKDLEINAELEDTILLPDDLEQLYRRWYSTNVQALELSERGQQQEAMQAFLESWEATIEDLLFPALDEALSIGTADVEQSFDRLLLGIGQLPWSRDRNLELLKSIRINLDYLVTSNRLNANYNRQFEALLNYLLRSGEDKLLKYKLSQMETENTLGDWSILLEKKLALEKGSPDLAATQSAGVNASYTRFLRQAKTAIELKKYGRPSAAIDSVVGYSDLLIADFHQNTSKAVNDAADTLTRRVSNFRHTGLVILLLLLVSVSLLSLHTLSSMLSTLKGVQSSMKKIRRGDLDQRITLKRENLLGNLAPTFNQMMDSLQKTQTDLKNLTAELEQRVDIRTRELADANNELRAFNSMVTHDLRSPLTTIGGYCQLLSLEEENLNSAMSEPVERINSAVENMNRIVSALESLSRTGQNQFSRQPVALDEMAKKILAGLAANDPNRQVDAEVATTPKASGDQNMLEVVLTNLLGNAWKYTGSTANARIEFGAEYDRGKQLWFVRDNGAGFDMSEAGDLFKPFSRLTSSKEFPGTGIGLFTVQRIIQRHGGLIWAESSPGEGTVFYFHLG